MTRARLFPIVLMLPACAHGPAGSADVAELCRQVVRDNERTAARLEEIAAKQATLAKRLDELDAKVGHRAAAQPTPGRPEQDVVYKISLGAAPWRGATEPKVTIVEWSDFQCPFCSRVDGTLQKILETWPDDVRIVFKHNPLAFHRQAMPAAIAAEAARRQGRFWEMHDLLFEDQRELSEEKIEGHAKRLQLDMRRFRKEIADPELKAYVEADQAQATKFGARGTPTFFINGRVLTGAQPFDRFKEKIEAELGRADALLKKGVPRAELYDRLTADGKDGA